MDFSGERGWRGRTGSTAVGIEKKTYREKSIYQISGVAVANCERKTGSG
jgi:hypothetical protein